MDSFRGILDTVNEEVDLISSLEPQDELDYSPPFNSNEKIGSHLKGLNLYGASPRSEVFQNISILDGS